MKSVHLSPQEEQIVKLLEDGRWHCPTAELYMKDDRARITALKRKHFTIIDQWCTDPLHAHYAKLKKRKIVAWPPGYHRYHYEGNRKIQVV